MNRRAYQTEAFREFAQSSLRLWALLWERQAGKSTTFADFALWEMLRHKNRTVIYGSASLLLGQEITLKTQIRADQTARELIAADARVLQAKLAEFEGSQENIQLHNSSTDKIVKEGAGLKPDDFAEMFSAQKLEIRLYHDKTSYSRTKVIAPNVATARSWSGTVLLDEIAFIRNLKELFTALLPIVSTNPDYKLILSTTPPEFDDTHFSFELLAPPPGLEFKPNANGNWYESESESKLKVHRADAFDTYLAGKRIYDLKDGREITPQDAFARSPNKEGHKIAHFLAWIPGGAAACDLLKLQTAQARGADQGCQNFIIDTDADMVPALNWLADHIHPKARVGLGFDVATTTKGKSNPSSVSVVEEHGPEWLVRGRFIWKTKDPDIANERLDRIIDCVARRGVRAVALTQDASNEKYYAEANRKRLRSKLPVILVVASEGITPEQKPGLDKPTNYKEWLGDTLVSKLDDNNLTLPADSYTREDYRLVMKDRGKFVCEPNERGMHGDSFDSDKLGGYALTAGQTKRTVVAPPPVPLVPTMPSREDATPPRLRETSSL